jgi:hypothetical protein
VRKQQQVKVAVQYEGWKQITSAFGTFENSQHFLRRRFLHVAALLGRTNIFHIVPPLKLTPFVKDLIFILS